MESPVTTSLSVEAQESKNNAITCVPGNSDERVQSSYGDYHREYYRKNKAKIWEKVKASDAYKEKYKRYYQKHKEILNKKRADRIRAKREAEVAHKDTG